MSRPRLRRWTLRTRLLAAVLGITAAGMVVFGTLSTALLGRSQLARIDDQIDRVTVGLVSAYRPPPPPTPPSSAGDDLLFPSTSRLLFYDPDGTLGGRLGIGDSTLLLPPMDTASVRARGSRPFTIGERDGNTKWRVAVVVQPPDPFEPEGGTAAVAIPLDTYYTTIAQLRTIELVTGAVLLCVLGIVAALLVRAGLSPLTRVEHTAEAIAEGDIDRRVTDVDPHTEVGRLGRAFNVMLGRLSTTLHRLADSEARLRAFVADASHELRTPLTSIRGYAELYRHGGAATTADVGHMMSRIEQEATRMGVLVEDLLLLAELDEERPLDLAQVDLAAVAGEVVHDAGIRAPERTLRLHIPAGAQHILGDEHRLRQVITNLVDNALTHTPPTAEIDVTVAPATTPPPNPVAVSGADENDAGTGDFIAVEVRDSGPGIPPDQARHVFDRFYRTDRSRARTSGSGLGLAIVTAILAAHDARIYLSTAPGHGTSFRILFRPDA
ncbi:sensor histidine kinase [Nocardia sp. alder85J]|uniref:sensor histidine kinase n=1 Tax=Nocardia sp. alder85J TaxID=2862949 RepID=UPI001CD4E7CF|nr:HAMP domain-containing sensor histidine kinase [Nocardia sp. alder85J]MCX4098082.1 HAMP domain-containing sensor histidine kinase [Nocardia sp. alder85J]